MYLLDTNIWLERLLEQTRTAEVEQFLNQISSEQILSMLLDAIATNPEVLQSLREALHYNN